MHDLVINSRLVIPADELEETFSRSGGPGGQNVNKVATQVELRWRPGESRALSDTDRAVLLIRLEGRMTREGELIVTSDRFRAQGRNRDDAREKLAEIVRRALLKQKRRRPTRRTKASEERRLEAKKRRSRLKAHRRSN